MKPSIAFILGSITRNANNDYQLRSALWDNPGAFFRNTVRPFAEQGYDIFLHRLFGEGIRGDRYMDIDTLYQMIERGHADARDYAKSTARETVQLADDFPDIQITVYIGAMLQPRVRQLFLDGKLDQWAEQIEYTIKSLSRWQTGGKPFKFVLDAAATYSTGSPEWAATRELMRRYPGLISIESLPNPRYSGQWGLPSVALYRHYKRFQSDAASPLFRTPEMLGEVTVGLWDHPSFEADFNNDLASFLVWCEREGVKPEISDEVISHATMSIEDSMTEANSRIADALRAEIERKGQDD